MRATTSAAESVVYPGRAFADAMQSVGLPAPTAVIPTGAPRDWPDAPPDIDVLSGCDRCAAEPFVLGVQNWYGHKRLDWLAAAWPEVAGESGAHLVLVGDPVRASDARRLRRALAPPGVGACVHVLSGISRCAIADLYRRAEAFVSSSLLEAGPQTPLEAMSFGIPCVLSDIGPHREYAGEAAEYFLVGDASSLRAALARARDRTGGAPPLAHDWDTNAELLAAELARIVGRPAQPGARSFATSTPGPAS